MIHQHEILDALKKGMKRGEKYELVEIYSLVERICRPDNEDYDPAGPRSPEPKWKRNVRNALQFSRKKGIVFWDSNGLYEHIGE